MRTRTACAAAALLAAGIMLGWLSAASRLATPSYAQDRSADTPAAQALDTRIGTLEFDNGYPSTATVQKLYDEIDFQRACQTYIWATPIVALDAMRIANNRDWGVDDNNVGLVDHFTGPDVVAWTGNSTTIYAASCVDLSRDGPVVVDSPSEAYGVIDDYWQRPIVEVGLFGPRVRAGNFSSCRPTTKARCRRATLPPAQTPTVLSTWYGASWHRARWECPGGHRYAGQDPYLPTLAGEQSPPMKIVKAGNKPMHTIAPSDFVYWERLAEIVNSESVEAGDRFFLAMLKPLGIEKGKPFQPDERQKKILTEAATVEFTMSQAISTAPRFEGLVAYPAHTGSTC